MDVTGGEEPLQEEAVEAKIEQLKRYLADDDSLTPEQRDAEVKKARISLMRRLRVGFSFSLSLFFFLGLVGSLRRTLAWARGARGDRDASRTVWNISLRVERSLPLFFVSLLKAFLCRVRRPRTTRWRTFPSKPSWLRTTRTNRLASILMLKLSIASLQTLATEQYV